MPSVSIAIQPDIFDRFSDLNFKPSQAIAEFVDNAIQSYLDYKNNGTFYHNGYKLTIDISIEWEESSDNKTFAKSIVIKDNAAGMAISKYEKAFETGHRPSFNEGLNEYGMGMKTAAYWLSRQWTIISKSFSENIERTLLFDVDDIVKNRHTSLDFKEIHIHGSESYTIVRLEKLHKKNNFTKRMLNSIKYELASIYRAFLRRGEIQINVNDEALLFSDPKILNAPYYCDPNEPSLEWKVQISKNLFGKEINGFIGILSEMSEKQSGLVIMRRGRVIVGESSDHLYHPKAIFGTYKNGFTYKRLYGEIEIKGFSASFNKNGFSNMEELETMLEILKSNLFVEKYSLIKQATELRVNSRPTTYTVCWKFNNGSPDKLESYNSNGKLLLPVTPIREEYTFEGWTPNPSVTVTTDAEYTAKWKLIDKPEPVIEYNVCWNFNNAQITQVDKYKKGDNLVLPRDPQKTGFLFDGWSPAPNGIVLNDTTYIALWKSVPTTITNKVIASKMFVYAGENKRMDLITADINAPFLTLDLGKFSSEHIVIGSLNIQKLPSSNKSAISDEIKEYSLKIAIGMFEAQMNGEDTCHGLMKYIK